MFCRNCGFIISAGNKVCAACGCAVDNSEQQNAPVTPVENIQPIPVEPFVPIGQVPVSDPVPQMQKPAPFVPDFGNMYMDESTPSTAKEEPEKNLLEMVKETSEAMLEKIKPLLSKIKPLLSKVKPLFSRVLPFVQKNRLILVGAGGVLALVLSICILVSLCSGSDYIICENALSVSVENDEVLVLWNDKAIETDIEADALVSSTTNLQGTMLVGLTDDGTLFLARKRHVNVVAENVIDFRLSDEGTGIAYVTKDDNDCKLYLYSVSNKKNTVADEDYSMMLGGMALSPDGKMLAYFDQTEDGTALMCFSGKKSIRITDEKVTLVGLSNGGKYIYVTGLDDEHQMTLYVCNRKGDMEKIHTCGNSVFYFNADHTQILFYDNEKSHISTKGKEAKNICSGMVSPLTAPGTLGTISKMEAITITVTDLYDKIYITLDKDGNNLWNIQKNANKSTKLATNGSGWKMSSEANYIYYLNQRSELCMLKISHGAKASDKAKVLAENVQRFVVTSNRKRVYFISNGGLYSCNGQNGDDKTTIASHSVSDLLVLNDKNVVYYIMDGDGYACNNGEKGTKVISDALFFRSYPNGVVYGFDEDAVYISSSGKKMKKLHNWN